MSGIDDIVRAVYLKTGIYGNELVLIIMCASLCVVLLAKHVRPK